MAGQAVVKGMVCWLLLVGEEKRGEKKTRPAETSRLYHLKFSSQEARQRQQTKERQTGQQKARKKDEESESRKIEKNAATGR